jgi:hypothetical protein
MEFISADKVPYTKKTKWDEIFASIPKGQALVIHEAEVRPEAVRTALSRRQKKGKFKNLKMIYREINGEIKSYIINTDKK